MVGDAADSAHAIADLLLSGTFEALRRAQAASGRPDIRLQCAHTSGSNATPSVSETVRWRMHGSAVKLLRFRSGALRPLLASIMWFKPELKSRHDLETCGPALVPALVPSAVTWVCQLVSVSEACWRHAAPCISK